jgi:hypothetical protein
MSADILLYMQVEMGIPLKIISKIILRYQDLKTTQVYLGKAGTMQLDDRYPCGGLVWRVEENDFSIEMVGYDEMLTHWTMDLSVILSIEVYYE